MGRLLLVEVKGSELGSELLSGIDATLQASGASVLEAQFTAARDHAFVILETPDDLEATTVDAALQSAGIDAAPAAAVRLVGAEVADIRAAGARAGGEYLVEWDLPAGLTMDAYLARKKEKAPLYDKVPEATFLRTYVREDMNKCLCFYDAEDEGAVLKARDAVSAPVDRLHHLSR